MNRMSEVTVLEDQLGGSMGLDLARFTQQLEDIIALDLSQVDRLDLVGSIDLVQGKGGRIREVDFLVEAEILDLALQYEADLLQALGYLELEDRLAVFEQFKIGDDLGADNAVAVR